MTLYRGSGSNSNSKFGFVIPLQSFTSLNNTLIGMLNSMCTVYIRELRCRADASPQQEEQEERVQDKERKREEHPRR